MQISSKIIHFHLFADDTSIFYSHQDPNTVESVLNAELSNVSLWLQANKLTLNVDKSNFIIFRPPQRKNIKNTSLSVKKCTSQGKILY